MIYENNAYKMEADFEQGCISRLSCGETNLLSGKAPLFEIMLRGKDGKTETIDAFSAKSCTLTEGGAEYGDFPAAVTVKVYAVPTDRGIDWKITISNKTDMAVEWVDFPKFSLKPLRKNSGIGEILLPYNEGVLIDDAYARDATGFCARDIEFPSMGCYYMFPNMMSSQFMAYLTDCGSLYIGAHDDRRGPKALDFRTSYDGVVLSIKTYTGCDFEEDFSMKFPMVTKFFDGTWEDAAEIYRSWFETALPDNVKKTADNPALPEWYGDSPLILAYPIRGIHDMDEMEPNALFPYINALPIIDEIAEAAGCRILVLLMHWEGTAPWAPPYVWPPYGGEEGFNAFLSALHDRGHLLGVYCSGFGWTLRSNLIAEYNKQQEWESGALRGAMCTAPDGSIPLSKICTAQRSGYDLCPASDAAKEILKDAYTPLFNAGIDYAQILDQNHGGGQYLCYSRSHGHPPVPGSWMTENMQQLLNEWNSFAPKTLFGCESAAAEPFIGNLLFSDNRFELNWHIGRAVPLYSYIYHEYLRNFMGNQVCCPFDTNQDTLRLRMAYSFTAGDCMTITLLPDGRFLPHWGCRDFTSLSDRDKTLLFVKNMMRFYRDAAKDYLLFGKMIKSIPAECESVSVKTVYETEVTLPAVFQSAWSYGGKKVQIFVNHTETPVTCCMGKKSVTVDALNALMIEID